MRFRHLNPEGPIVIVGLLERGRAEEGVKANFGIDFDARFEGGVGAI